MPDFGWNPLTGRFYDLLTGRFLKFQFIRDFGVEPIVSASKSNMQSLTDSLIAGNISLADWQLGMMNEIKEGHKLAALAANGGINQMSPSDWGYVGDLVKDQYSYLRNFAKQIQSGKQPLNGSARTRAGLYADAIENSFENFRRRKERLLGAIEERRILNPQKEHCVTRNGLLGCEELAAVGWVPIGTLPRIGESPCMVYCGCHFIFRKKVNGEWLVSGE